VTAFIAGTEPYLSYLADQLIVVLFLIVTTGLLVYALIRPYVQNWLAVSVHLESGLMDLEGAESETGTRDTGAGV